MEEIKMFYCCDRKACKNCNEYCEYTSDIEHAVHKGDLYGRKFKAEPYRENVIGLFEVKED